jgi:hypothetical protein
MNCLQYKIELRIRNHTTLSRLALIEAIAQCVPEGHIVDLDDPELFIIVEVFKVSSWQTLMSKLHRFSAEYLWGIRRSGLLQVAEVQCGGDR